MLRTAATIPGDLRRRTHRIPVNYPQTERRQRPGNQARQGSYVGSYSPHRGSSLPATETMRSHPPASRGQPRKHTSQVHSAV